MKKEKISPEEKIRVPRWSFARGSISYFFLAAVIAIALLFGIFDPLTMDSEKIILGSYGDYQIIANKQGMNVYEVTLQFKGNEKDSEPVEIDNIKNIMWIAAQTFEIQSFHPIEENGKTYGLIITTK
ncbi:MAG: hypothetical protein JW737_10170 [Acidobacteria bacterium]|nr:hypothetical protein [Acidobacteriota bacterium]